MRTAFLIIAVYILTAFAAPTVPITKRAGPVQAGSYIITLNDGVSKDSHIAKLLSNTTDVNVTYTYGKFFPGYAAKLTAKGLDLVRRSTDVKSIDEDAIFPVEDNEVELADEPATHPSKRDSPVEARGWGCFGSCGEPEFNGQGVDIYVIDTGIYIEHECFGGRARHGWTFEGGEPGDSHGQGTSVASRAAGRGYGLATGANVIAVKVGDDLNWTVRNLTLGLQYVVDAAALSGRPSVAILSGFPIPIDIPDDRTYFSIQSVAERVPFVMPAGDREGDTDPPPRPHINALTVVSAVKSKFRKVESAASNRNVDVWAQGYKVKCAGRSNPSLTVRPTGTPYAAAHVAGLLAVAIEKHGPKTPRQLRDALLTHAKIRKRNKVVRRFAVLW